MFNHTLIKRSLLVGLTATAAAFPVAAQAQYVMSAGGSLSAAAQVPVTGPQPAAPATTVSATTQSGSSFHWDDAGIGAGAAVVLLGVGALGAGATRRRSQPVIG